RRSLRRAAAFRMAQWVSNVPNFAGIGNPRQFAAKHLQRDPLSWQVHQERLSYQRIRPNHRAFPPKPRIIRDWAVVPEHEVIGRPELLRSTDAKRTPQGKRGCVGVENVSITP